MTCSQCIHNGICIWTQVDSKNKKVCKDFKNKSDYAEVKHGKWIYDYSGECVSGTDAPLCQKCSECGEYTVNEENFCPNCGAIMDAKNDFKE